MSRILKNLGLIRSVLLLVLVSPVFTVLAHSQSSPADPVSSEPKSTTSPSTHESNQTDDPKAELPRFATREEMRQAEIEADTKRLYQLSAELRAEVAKTYKESLSLTVLKKAEEIEKLARSLKVRINQEAAAARN